MPITEERVQVTISLPKALADQLTEAETLTHRSLDEQVCDAVESVFRRREAARAAVEAARKAYEAELARTGKPRPTTEELWEQMRRIREEVANELYPD